MAAHQVPGYGVPGWQAMNQMNGLPPASQPNYGVQGQPPPSDSAGFPPHLVPARRPTLAGGQDLDQPLQPLNQGFPQPGYGFPDQGGPPPSLLRTISAPQPGQQYPDQGFAPPVLRQTFSPPVPGQQPYGGQPPQPYAMQAPPRQPYGGQPSLGQQPYAGQPPPPDDQDQAHHPCLGQPPPSSSAGLQLQLQGIPPGYQQLPPQMLQQIGQGQGVPMTTASAGLQLLTFATDPSWADYGEDDGENDDDDNNGELKEYLILGTMGLQSKRPSRDIDLLRLYKDVDKENKGTISLLQFANAVQRDEAIASRMLPGVDCSRIFDEPEAFDAVNALFLSMSGGKARIDFTHFKEHFRHPVVVEKFHDCFNKIDVDRNGLISKIELINATKRREEVYDLLFPGVSREFMQEEDDVFDAVNAIFDAMACGKTRVDITDFSRYFTALGPSTTAKVRRGQRILIIGPGFGAKINPRQSSIILEAGFQVHFVHELPNPEVQNFPMMVHLPQLKIALDEFQPDLVMAASKGGAYLVALWATNFWRGPSLLINAHPSCTQLPKHANVILAVGSNDEVYLGNTRADLEKLVATGGKNKTFFYYVADSGRLASGQKTRLGDNHNMQSLVSYDCLPRLIDAVLDTKCPETSMHESWRNQLSKQRLDAESHLGLTPMELKRFWQSQGKKGRDPTKLMDVSPESPEYANVIQLIKSAPLEVPAYCGSNFEAWQAREVLHVQRVENGEQMDLGFQPYYESLRHNIIDQGLSFNPGVHTRWAFHGAEADAINSIVATGFQPLATGTKGATLWGSGTYFAREAKYVAEGGFAKASADGVYKMLACQVLIGIACLGDPNQHGILPARRGLHRYNSTVDSLSSPEIFIVQHPSAVYPAYMITFR